MELNALLAQPLVLPSLPRTVALLMNELGDAQPDLRRLNQLFGSDPALAARLLHTANTTFGAQRQVCAIPEALALLGMPQLRALVTQAAPGITSRSVPGLNLQHFWRYSLNTAKLARALAGLVRHNPAAAYTAGLLHGLGEVALLVQLHQRTPARMQSIDSMAGPLEPRRARLEQRLLGYSYAQVSAGLAVRWQLPQTVVDALLHHVAPFDNSVYEPLAAVLHLAAWRARAREAGQDQRELATSFPGEVGVALGLDIDVVLQQDPIDWSGQRDEVDLLL